MSVNPTCKREITILFKPTSCCNLRCGYCFAHTNRDGLRSMTDIEMESSIKWVFDYVALQKIGSVQWLWHGGEPMLIGAEKFQKLNEYIKILSAEIGCRINFRIQTNLTLLNEQWIGVFGRDYKRGIGTSLDYKTFARVDKQGVNYDELVQNNIHKLQKRGFSVGAITLVTPANIGLVREMYEFYKSRMINFKTSRFFPSSSPLPDERKYLVNDDEYSRFLCELFDIWYDDPAPKIKVGNLQEMAVGIVRGERCLCLAAKSSCVGNFLCIESGGEIYNCGRYDAGKFMLGTIYDNPAKVRDAVRERLSAILPTKCSTCSFVSLCNGGCRFERDMFGKYFDCAVTQNILSHIARRLKKSGVMISGELGI